MSWLLFAFSGPILWAASTHLDKYLVERFFKESNVALLLVFTALAGVALLPPIWFFQRDVFDLELRSIVLMSVSGILYMGGLFFYLQALQSEEASIVAPFFQASPLFGYVLAYVVLGERLTAIQMLGGVLIIAGASLVSLRPGINGGKFRARTAALMLACALAMALSSLIFKALAVREQFWPTTFWMFVGEAIFGAGLLAVTSFRRQFVALLRSHLGALVAINGANELINLGGALGNRYALLLAPLSLVQAVGSTTTLFVFLFGIILTLVYPQLGRESLSPRELIQKGAAAVLVAVGVACISK